MRFWIQSMGGHSNWMYVPEFNFMIDAGEGAASSMGIGNLAAMKNLFITHHHWDHVAGLIQMLNLRKRQQMDIPMTIWHPPSTKMDAIKKMVGGGVKWEIVEKDKEIPVAKNMFVEAFPAKHRGATAFGFRCKERRTRRRQEFSGMTSAEISRIVQSSKERGDPVKINEDYTFHIFTYTGDTEPLSMEMIGAPETLMHDSTYLPGMEAMAIEHGHSSLGHALSARKESGAKVLIGLHLSPRHRLEIPKAENVLIPAPCLKTVRFEVDGGELKKGEVKGKERSQSKEVSELSPKGPSPRKRGLAQPPEIIPTDRRSQVQDVRTLRAGHSAQGTSIRATKTAVRCSPAAIAK